MKFKTIFLIFNLVLSLTFLFIFFLPLLVLGLGPALSFWGQWWYLGLAFLLLLGFMDWIYLSNAAVYSFMEKDDIPGLLEYLNHKILVQKKFSALRVRLFLQASVRAGQVDKIKEIGELLAGSRPSLAKKFALNLSLPYFGDFEALRNYAEKSRVGASKTIQTWLNFLSAFAFLQEKDPTKAKDLLLPGALQNQDPVLQLLALYYLLEAVAPTDPSLSPRLNPVKQQLKKRYAPQDWEKLIQKNTPDTLVLVILSKVLQTARVWLQEKQEHQ